MNIKEKANEAYYNTGEPIITDKEFDLISDHGLETVNFRNKVQHELPMGSLKKIKAKDDFDKWIGKTTKCFISPKLDGNSIEMVFNKGILVKAVTRGDGFVGNDVTEKVKMCNYRPMDTGSYKAEAIMPKKYQEGYDKNIRNVVSGLLNKKDNDDALLDIDIVFFNDIQTFFDIPSYERIEKVFSEWKETYKYEIDGIVVSLLDDLHKETDPLLPANIIALKFNKEGVDATIGNIEWNLGKHGRLTPVLVLANSVDIDGSSVSRVSASNYGLLKEAGLGVGAAVKVIKSGDIIPFLSEVTTPVEFDLNIICPNCGTKASISNNGIHAICSNCTEDTLTLLKHIFKVFDLEYISDSTVETLHNAGYNTLEKIFELKAQDISILPGMGKKKANNIIAKLNEVRLTEAQVLECAMVKGISSTQSKKLIDYFGSIEEFMEFTFDPSDIAKIDSFGEILSETVCSNALKFNQIYDVLKRYINIVKQEIKPSELNVVCTGKCEKYGRKELETILGNNGCKLQSSVNKDTDFVLTDDINGNSSKLKKANKLGIKVISYDDYLVDI